MRILLTLIFALSLQSLHAQAIHDAIALKKFLDAGGKIVDGGNSEALYNILKRNRSGLEKSNLETDVVASYKENPFIAPYLSVNLTVPRALEDEDEVRARSLGSLDVLSTGLGMPSSTLISGLTDFLVMRTKQELTIAFFRDFQKKVQESEEMQYLFPTTTKILLQIDKDIYRINAFWEVLRESFLQDLDQMLYQLDDYVQQSSRITDPVAKYMMSDFFKVLEMLHDEAAPTEVINYLAKDAYLHVLTPADDTTGFVTVMQNNLELIGLISNSLENADADGYWVEPNMIMYLLRDSTIADFYLGFLYQAGKDIKIGDKTFGEYLLALRSASTKSRGFVNEIKRFLDKANAVARLAKEINKRNKERRRNPTAAPPSESDIALDYDDYFEFTEGVIELANFGYQFKQKLIGSSSKEDSTVYKYLSIMSDLNVVALNIRKKHYSSALLNTLFVVEKLLPPGKFSCERQSLLKYGTFIATAAEAKTSKEVSEAISAFALPPGSAAIKKYSNFSVTLNAYVGLSAGQERLENFGSKAYYAVATPIGVSMNWGFKAGGSLSLLASALDVGALTAYRFKDPNVGQLPELRFENVFAPGGYLVYAVPKYPLAVGFGAQMGPNLRSVDNGALQTSTSGWRWGAFIAVDIPIVSIYTSNKYYKKCCKDCK